MYLTLARKSAATKARVVIASAALLWRPTVLTLSGVWRWVFMAVMRCYGRVVVIAGVVGWPRVAELRVGRLRAGRGQEGALW